MDTHFIISVPADKIAYDHAMASVGTGLTEKLDMFFFEVSFEH